MSLETPPSGPLHQKRTTTARSPSSRPAWASLTMPEVLKGFHQPIRPIEIPRSYAFSVFLVALALISLMLFYFCLVGLIGFAAIYYFISTLPVANANTAAWIFLCLLPSIFGFVFVLFLVKPIFAPPGKRSDRLALTRQYEPVLFAFVDHLCACVGAPAPTRIDVDFEPNASASLRRGMVSLFNDDLVLTIGLPLVAGMNIRQVAGILAHEFGHFTQGSAMRFSYIIGRVNGWFYRVVYERDAWDERLIRFSEMIPVRAGGFILLFLRLLIWLSRKLLWLLMQAGHIFSCYMSRQMEYDADRHETRIAGTSTFIQTSLDLHVLSIAWSMTIDDLQESWLENRLGDDLPAMVVANARVLRSKQDVMNKVHKQVLEAKTGWLDTHPSPTDRISHAKLEDAPGVFTVEAPAHVLFRDFSALSKAVSIEFYREQLEQPIEPHNLVPTSILVAERQETSEAHKTLYRYFQGKVLGSYEIFLPQDACYAPLHARAALDELRRSRQSMLAQLERISQAVQHFDKADERLRELAVVGVLLESGFQIHARRFNLPNSRPQTIKQLRQQAEADRSARITELEQSLRDARSRMASGLQLLHVPDVAARLEKVDALRKRLVAISETHQVLQRAWPQVLRLREVRNVLQLLLSTIEGDRISDSLHQQIMRLSGVATNVIGQIRIELFNTSYPFQHAKGKISVADFALAKLPDGEQPFEVVRSANEMLEKLIGLYYRVMAHLAVCAEKVEEAIGLPPLPEPPEQE